uniref:Uncharacterized protein n=1 Tax=Rheinheimera sp. BAL341 TaxID=1708203 RepID=A0A486XNN8_9GAMM
MIDLPVYSLLNLLGSEKIPDTKHTTLTDSNIKAFMLLSIQHVTLMGCINAVLYFYNLAGWP